LNKDYYQAGDTAKVSFFWSGSADGFPGSRLGTSTPKALTATFTLADDQKNSCAESFIQTLNVQNQSGVEYVSIPVTGDCQNPAISVKIADIGGKVLAQNSYEIQSKNIPQEKTNAGSNSNLVIVIITLAAVAIMVAVSLYFLKKKKLAGEIK